MQPPFASLVIMRQFFLRDHTLPRLLPHSLHNYNEKEGKGFNVKCLGNLM